MVQDGGSPGLQKQTIKPESLRGMESRYEDVLVELGRVIKVKDVLALLLCKIQTWKSCNDIYLIQHLGRLFIHDN